MRNGLKRWFRSFGRTDRYSPDVHFNMLPGIAQFSQKRAPWRALVT
jgi:hypothetical protein